MNYTSFDCDFDYFNLEEFRGDITIHGSWLRLKSGYIYYIVLVDSFGNRLGRTCIFFVDHWEDFNDVVIPKLYSKIYSTISFSASDLKPFTDQENRVYNKFFQVRVYDGFVNYSKFSKVG